MSFWRLCQYMFGVFKFFFDRFSNNKNETDFPSSLLENLSYDHIVFHFGDENELTFEI